MSDQTAAVEPRILPRPEHPVSRKYISENALKVLYRLHQKGYKGYLVGGSVRDLMLGGSPKDFDVGTDARPHEVRKVFRNSRTIGRRFKIVHVYFKGEVIEVSTFRADPDPDAQTGPDGQLLVTRDNTWGGPREDAFRRDFTVNALFYDIADFSVIDWVGGIDDLKEGVIRVIGDPDVRFQEDPVRMMRAAEFAGRLGFTIEPATMAGIRRHRKKIELASAARVTEEVVELMKCGSAGDALEWMLELGLLEYLLPEAYTVLTGETEGVGTFDRLLPSLDRKFAEGEELTDAMLLGTLLLPTVLLRRDDIEAVDERPMSRSAIRSMIHEILEPFAARFTLSKNRTSQVFHALVAFHRLCEPEWTPGKRVQFARRPYFDDALKIFELLVEATGEGREELKHWEAAARHRNRGRDSGADGGGGDGGRKGRRGRRPRRRGRRRGRQR